jgi:hypothetical protein
MDTFHDSVPDIAVHGESGIDVFRRRPAASERLSRFECLCTLRPSGAGGHVLIAHSGTARHARPAIEAAADRLAGAPWLNQVFALGRPAGYATPPSGASIADKLLLVLHLDFLRAWQVAELAVAGLEAGIAARPGISARQARNILQLLVDFNRPRRARPLVVRLMPRLLALPADADAAEAAGALRLAGELCRRRGDARLALAAYEGALRFGATRGRIQRAQAAARAAGDAAAEARIAAHLPRVADLARP